MSDVDLSITPKYVKSLNKIQAKSNIHILRKITRFFIIRIDFKSDVRCFFRTVLNITVLVQIRFLKVPPAKHVFAKAWCN